MRVAMGHGLLLRAFRRTLRLLLLAATLLAALTTTCQALLDPDELSLLAPGFHALPCASAHSVSLCGRTYHPDFLSPVDSSLLLSLATSAFALTPGGSGPVSIVDMVSGALSHEDKFVNLFQLLKRNQCELPLAALQLYRSLTSQLAERLSSELSGGGRLYLTRPSFFSRIRAAEAMSAHDEYYHPHIDREQYGTFEATALIYLSDWGRDFDGGEFVFMDAAANRTGESNRVQREVEAAQTDEAGGEAATAAAQDSAVTGSSGESAAEWVLRPSTGALAFFSSGSENTHFVRRVTSGTRYALTIAFTRSEEDSVEAVLDKLYGQRLAEWQASQSTAPDEVE